MHKPTLLYICSLLFTITCTFSVGSAAEEVMLESMSTKEFDEFYVASRINGRLHKRIYIEDPVVGFSEKWLSLYEPLTTPNYRRRIKQRYGEALKKELSKVLKSQGWELARESEDAIRVEVKMHDIYISAPEQSLNTTVMIMRNAGSAAITLTYLSDKGDPLMKIIDFERAPNIVGSALANRSNNFVYFKLLMTNWAKLSTAYLDSLAEEVDKHRRK